MFRARQRRSACTGRACKRSCASWEFDGRGVSRSKASKVIVTLQLFVKKENCHDAIVRQIKDFQHGAHGEHRVRREKTQRGVGVCAGGRREDAGLAPQGACGDLRQEEAASNGGISSRLWV